MLLVTLDILGLFAIHLTASFFLFVFKEHIPTNIVFATDNGADNN